MNHSFDTEHASAYGLNEAILIQNLQFWISKNKANGKHEYGGATWTYNSAKALAEMFPYLSDRQIRRAIDSLEAQGVIKKGNFNPSTYDRTLWFSFVQEELFLTLPAHSPKTANGAPKGLIHSPKTANGLAESGDSEEDVNTDVNTDTKGEAQAPAIPANLLKDFLEVRKAKRAGPFTKTALKGLQREADKAGVSLEVAVTACCEYGWQAFHAGWYAERTAKTAARGPAFITTNQNKHAGAAAAIWGAPAPQHHGDVIDV